MKKNVFMLIFILISAFYFATKPQIIILATGGTIAGVGTSGDRAGYTAGKIPVSELIGSIPYAADIADITGEQISSVGSQNMTIDIWKKLAVRINEIFAKNEADGIVITHGTDTQEETAYFLNLVVKDNRPVVLTGAMRSATSISADGPKNLYDAIVVASSDESKGKGVIVCFNESIFDPREVTKTSSTKVNGFKAPETGPLGEVFDGKVTYYKSSLRANGHKSPFSVNQDIKLPKVEIVYMYTDASPDYILNLVKQKVDAIVIAGVGNGNFSDQFNEAIKKAVKAKIVVCRASRCESGRVVLDGEVNDNELGTIVSDDLNPQKARILLMLGLTTTKDIKKLQELFFKY